MNKDEIIAKLKECGFDPIVRGEDVFVRIGWRDCYVSGGLYVTPHTIKKKIENEERYIAHTELMLERGFQPEEKSLLDRYGWSYNCMMLASVELDRQDRVHFGVDKPEYI